jgi:hypothetical protein
MAEALIVRHRQRQRRFHLAHSQDTKHPGNFRPPRADSSQRHGRHRGLTVNHSTASIGAGDPRTHHSRVGNNDSKTVPGITAQFLGRQSILRSGRIFSLEINSNSLRFNLMQNAYFSRIVQMYPSSRVALMYHQVSNT